MGNPQSYPGLTEEVLEDYISLTYLNRAEIIHLMKKFYSIDPRKLDADSNHRFHMDDIVAKFDALKNNPFRDRICRVFSSKADDCFSFEDLLDLCSVMSSECLPEVKAEWAFRIYDIDEDKQITARDICEILDRLTVHGVHRERTSLDQPSKDDIANVIIKEMNLDSS